MDQVATARAEVDLHVAILQVLDDGIVQVGMRTALEHAEDAGLRPDGKQHEDGEHAAGRDGLAREDLRHRDSEDHSTETGEREEPMEEVVIDVDDAYVGAVVEALGERKGEMTDMRPPGGGKTRVVFVAPARGLIGYHGQFLNDTRGTGVMSRLFHSYAPHKGAIPGRRNGVLISNATGKSVPFALWNLEDRGSLVGRKVTGVSMVLASSAILYHATMAAVRFFQSARDAGDEMSKSTYYALLAPVTLPATIAFVYLNWLSASFFKSA